MMLPMNHQAAMALLSGERKDVLARLARPALWLAAKPYEATMRLRRWAYRQGVLRSRRPEPAGPQDGNGVPVLAIGNLTAGGTGKTPMAAWIVRRLRAAGYKPAVVLRGYKSVAGQSDEALLLSHLCNASLQPSLQVAGASGPDQPRSATSPIHACQLRSPEDWVVPVIANADRILGGRQALAAGADVLVLDDAFQHLRIRRDLDIVLIDATNPFGYGHCLPRGLLREGLWALRSAQVVAITRSDAVEPSALGSLRDTLARHAPQATLLTARHAPTCLLDEQGCCLPPGSATGMAFHAFCGIANGGSFFATLSRAGLRLATTRAMDDHCTYNLELLRQLSDEARAAAAGRLITTQKDYTKIAPLLRAPGAADLLPIWQLAIEMQVDDERVFLERIRESLK